MAVALGFLGVIAAGTALLAAPWSSASGAGTPLSDALFTATSATCLTGLITVDTATHWSTAGQVTIMALIQFGGLGFMTMASLMALLVGGRMGLRRRLGATAEGRGLDLGDVAWVVRATVLFTLVVELLVALVLTVRFHAGYGYGWGRAAWEGAFHAISGFNNAGFALYTNNVIGFAADAWVLLPLAFALMIGGIGFPVLLEVARRFRAGFDGRPRRRWSLTARFTLIGTAILVPAGTAMVALGVVIGRLASKSRQKSASRTMYADVLQHPVVREMLDKGWFPISRESRVKVVFSKSRRVRGLGTAIRSSGEETH